MECKETSNAREIGEKNFYRTREERVEIGWSQSAVGERKERDEEETCFCL